MHVVDKRTSTSIVLIYSENYAYHSDIKIRHYLKGNHNVLERIIKRNERKICLLLAKNKGAVKNNIYIYIKRMWNMKCEIILVINEATEFLQILQKNLEVMSGKRPVDSVRRRRRQQQ